jgi:hypothetical protein
MLCPPPPIIDVGLNLTLYPVTHRATLQITQLCAIFGRYNLGSESNAPCYTQNLVILQEANEPPSPFDT